MTVEHLLIAGLESAGEIDAMIDEPISTVIDLEDDRYLDDHEMPLSAFRFDIQLSSGDAKDRARRIFDALASRAGVRILWTTNLTRLVAQN